jgi:hypothetical protein
VDDGVWGVLGANGGGKSTLLAGFAAAGYGVMTDDLLVAAEGAAFAGPRCVDLRTDAAEALAAGENIGIVGARERWRLRLEEVPAALPLRGWVALGWSNVVSVRTVAPAERLSLLIENAAIVSAQDDPLDLFELSSLPTLILERPRQFGALGKSVEAVVDAIASRTAASP